MDVLHEQKEPSEWRRLHVGAEREVNCEHMQALVTNIFQRHWEWQEDRHIDLQREGFRCNTVFMESWGVKTAFDGAKPSVVSKILTRTGVHGHLTAALLAEMQDVRALRTARLNFGILGASAKEVWRLLCCGGALPNTCFGKRRKKWRAQGWGFSFGGQHDNEYTLRGMMWADNYWLFSDNREK